MRSFAAVFAFLVAPSLAVADNFQAGTQPRTYPAPAAPSNQLPVTPLVAYPGRAVASVGGLQLERAAYCDNCHTLSRPWDYNNTSPGQMWQGTMMANAARDPLFYAALAVANQDAPGIGGDYCLRCHSPSGFLAGHTLPNPPATVNGQPGPPVDTVNNPNSYPCNSYEPGSMTLCRCLNPAGCGATPTMRDFCVATPQQIANGYCVVAFDDRADAAFKGHPSDPTVAHEEPYDQSSSADPNGVAADPFDDSEGVQCALCHRLDPSANTTRRYGGNYLLSNAADQKGTWLTPRTRRFGPFNDSYTNCTDANNAATCNSGVGDSPAHLHPIQQSALHTASTLCGICHDVTNPTLHRFLPGAPPTDAGYNMPIERTFSEWAASDYAPGGASAETCQGCHMPKARMSGPVCTAAGGGMSYNRPSPGLAGDVGVPQHLFTGGSVWMPTVFRDLMAPPADPKWLNDLVLPLSRGSDYDWVSRAAADTLASAATLAVTSPPSQARSGESFAFTVRVTNKTGHKLPTGYPEGRRMWLMVTATAPTNAPALDVFASGRYDDSSGVLTRDSQLKIYEVELGRLNDAVDPYPQKFHFATNQIVYKDNRIPPAGFNTAAASYAEMAPVPADSYPAISGRLVNYDDTSYTVAVPAWSTGDVAVTVSLVYQSTSKDYIEFLASENTTNPRGGDMKKIWSNHGRAPYTVMATQSFVVANAAPCVPAPEICNGRDNDCDGVVGNGVDCGDMTASAGGDDLGAGGGDLGPAAPKKRGCGLSLAGNDWTDLGPFSLCIVLMVIQRMIRARLILQRPKNAKY